MRGGARRRKAERCDWRGAARGWWKGCNGGVADHEDLDQVAVLYAGRLDGLCETEHPPVE